MLAALVYLYLNGDGSWSIQHLYQAGASLTSMEQQFVFIGLFLAFAIKIPIVPFHGWQPDTYQSAPLQGTLLLSTLMGKMGLWGIIKWLIPMTPLAFGMYQNGLIILCVISVVYASIIALQQTEIKRLFAWASMAHVSLMAAGIFVWQRGALEGSLQQMFNHGVITLALFYCGSVITTKTGITQMTAMSGIRNNMPSFSGFFLWIVMASIALPLTSGFPGEFIILSTLYQYHPWIAAFAGLGTILGAVYMLRAYHQMMHGNSVYTFHDIHQNNKALLAVGSGLILVLGLFPNLLSVVYGGSIDNFLLQFSSNQ
jgi:NADH-quinone oxidoreductase subunit M